MSAYPEVELCCDGAAGPFDCDFVPPIHAHTAAKARAIAVEYGWLTARPGGKDYCPKHRPPGRLLAELNRSAQRSAEGAPINEGDQVDG